MLKRAVLYLTLLCLACWLSWKGNDLWEQFKADTYEHFIGARNQAPGLTLTSATIDEINDYLTATRRLYNSRSFDALERVSTSARDNREVFADGSSKILRFYRSLECREEEPESMWLLHDQIHQDWIRAKPGSFTAKIAYADFLVNFAMHARDFDLKKTVPPQVAEIYRSRLQFARKVLDEVPAAQSRDPGYWWAMLQLSWYQVWSTAARERLLEEAHKAEPQFWELDVMHAKTLISKQFGNKNSDAWETFARSAAARAEGLGSEVYARIVIELARNYDNIFAQTKASWKATRDGALRILARCPNNEKLVCIVGDLACIAGDADFATQILSKVGVEFYGRTQEAQEAYDFEKNTQSLFNAKDFSHLEELARTVRNSRSLMADGSWKIHHFYSALDFSETETEDAWVKRMNTYKDWSRAYPDSVTARVAYADFLVSYAWKARGHGYASTVTETGWKLMHERLQAAYRTLEQARTIKEHDPKLPEVLLTIGMGLRASKEQFDTIVSTAHRNSPNYWHHHVSRAYTLLPRWYGKPGEWQAYAASVADRPDGLGDELYARIVLGISNYGENIFNDPLISWERVGRGIRIIRQKYPDAPHLISQFTRIAVQSKKRELAKEAFETIGVRYSPSAWREAGLNAEYFLNARRWALQQSK